MVNNNKQHEIDLRLNDSDRNPASETILTIIREWLIETFPLLNVSSIELRDIQFMIYNTLSLSRFPILTRHGELMLFLKMNYAKYMLTKCNNAQIPYYMKLASEARNQIAEHNLRLVVSISKSMIPTDIDDMISEGNIALLQAVDAFDVERKNMTGGTNKFSTYATVVIMRNLRRVKQVRPKVPTLPIDEIDEVQSKTDEDMRDTYEKIGHILRIVNNRHILTQREKDVILYYYGIDRQQMTLSEIGVKFKVTKERIRQIKEKAISKVLNSYLSSGETVDKPVKTPNRHNDVAAIMDGVDETIRIWEHEGRTNDDIIKELECVLGIGK